MKTPPLPTHKHKACSGDKNCADEDVDCRDFRPDGVAIDEGPDQAGIFHWCQRRGGRMSEAFIEKILAYRRDQPDPDHEQPALRIRVFPEPGQGQCAGDAEQGTGGIHLRQCRFASADEANEDGAPRPAEACDDAQCCGQPVWRTGRIGSGDDTDETDRAGYPAACPDLLLQHEDGEDHDHDRRGEIERGEFRQPQISGGAVEQHPGGEHERCANDDGAAIFAFEDGGVAIAICQDAGNQHDECASHEEDLRDLVAFDQPFDERILQRETGVAHGRQPDAEKRPCFQ